jgi:hypothetical protein
MLDLNKADDLTLFKAVSTGHWPARASQETGVVDSEYHVIEDVVRN